MHPPRIAAQRQYHRSRGIVEFLREALALMPAGWKVRCVRADGGFFAEELLKFLEEHSLAYVIVARLTKNIKAKVAGISTWTLIDEDYAVGDLMAQLSGWKRERRFFVVGECIRENKGAIGR